MPYDREIMTNFMKFVFQQGLLGSKDKKPDNLEYALSISQMEENISMEQYEIWQNIADITIKQEIDPMLESDNQKDF